MNWGGDIGSEMRLRTRKTCGDRRAGRKDLLNFGRRNPQEEAERAGLAPAGLRALLSVLSRPPPPSARVR